MLASSGCSSSFVKGADPFVNTPPQKKHWDVKKLTPGQREDLANCQLAHNINKEISEKGTITEFSFKMIYVKIAAGFVAIWSFLTGWWIF